ncbi:Hypothetical predicted protein [Octopus vulgaris]|uniref:Uncharacterized protein n=1 Tax=Octopus vulgaris TaxID=6645 RepID=A0AA36B609_OCTVU|nr:Hypothetical predicted protein [Octopus vulgaris]
MGLVLPPDFIQGLGNIRHHLGVLRQKADIRINEGLLLQLCRHPVDSSPILLLQDLEDNSSVIGRVPSATVGDYQPPLQRVQNVVCRHHVAALQIPQPLCLGLSLPVDRLERNAIKSLVAERANRLRHRDRHEIRLSYNYIVVLVIDILLPPPPN